MQKIIPFIILLFFTHKAFANVEIIEPIDDKSKDFQIDSRIRIENYSQRNYQSTNKNERINDSQIEANFNSVVTLKHNWFFDVWYRLDNVKQRSQQVKRSAGITTGDNWYENEGTTLREMKFGYKNDHFTLYAGKFRALFGMAWMNGRGMWGDFVGNNYEQNEKLGLGTILKAGNDKTIGRYELGVSFFTNDRKNFDNSLITTRDAVHKSPASPGDTRKLDSYVASLDIFYNFSENEKLFYRFSYINLAINSRNSNILSNKIADQKGFSAMIDYKYPVSENFILNPFLEYAEMKNLGGNSDISENYFSSSLVGTYKRNWNLTLAYNNRKSKNADKFSLPYGYNQNMTEISGGYQFLDNKFFDSLLFQLAYRNLETNNRLYYKDHKNSVGILIRYIKNF